VAGVVYSHFDAEEQVEEVERDGKVETRTSLRSRSAKGAVAPGDYLLLIVLGQAQVRASAAAGSITPGDLLAVGGEGQAARMAGAYTPGTLLGTAMEALDAAQGSELIWVMVNPDRGRLAAVGLLAVTVAGRRTRPSAGPLCLVRVAERENCTQTTSPASGRLAVRCAPAR